MDDILLTGSNLSTIQALKQHLHSSFGIKDLGLMHYFLGIEVSYLPTGIVLSQNKYTKDILKLVCRWLHFASRKFSHYLEI